MSRRIGGVVLLFALVAALDGSAFAEGDLTTDHHASGSLTENGGRTHAGGGSNGGDDSEHPLPAVPDSPAVPVNRPASGTGRSGGGSVEPTRRLSCDYFLTTPAGESKIELGSALARSIVGGTLVTQICHDLDDGSVHNVGPVAWPGPAGPPLPGGLAVGVPVAPAPEDLAVEAEADLVLAVPVVRTWPPAGRILVGLETWFHVDSWEADTRTAEAGGVSSTVMAEPVRVVWHLGETDLTCSTAGTVWAAGRDVTDCGYVFHRYTGERTGAAGDASVEVVYHVRWTSNLGAGGDLGEVARATTFPLRVWEAQAVLE